MNFNFEDVFESIDEALQEGKTTIFIIPRDPLELIQPNWSTQRCHALECYNVTIEGDDEDPRNINIPEAEDHHEFEGPPIENPDITMPLKTRQVNIGMEVEPKFPKSGDYRDDATVDEVVELIHEYQDLFPTKFSDLKGIIGDFWVMKITLKPNVKLLRKGHITLIPNTRKGSAWSWIRCL